MLNSFLPVCYAYFLPRKKMRKSRRTIRTTMVIIMDSTIHSQMRDRLRPRFLALNILNISSLFRTLYADASLFSTYLNGKKWQCSLPLEISNWLICGSEFQPLPMTRLITLSWRFLLILGEERQLRSGPRPE